MKRVIWTAMIGFAAVLEGAYFPLQHSLPNQLLWILIVGSVTGPLWLNSRRNPVLILGAICMHGFTVMLAGAPKDVWTAPFCLLIVAVIMALALTQSCYPMSESTST